VVTRRELAALADQLYILKTAIDDVERDLAGTKPDVRDYAEALAWVLEAARPLCQMSKSGATPSQSGATPSQSGATPSQSGATPSQSGATPSKSGSIRPR